MSYHEHESARSLSDHGRNNEFKEFLCHPKHSILVYILSNKFVALRSYDVDYAELFEVLLNPREKVSNGCNSTEETVDKL